MRKLGQVALVLAGLALMAPAAQAQEKKGKKSGGGRSRNLSKLMLLSQKSVQEELKLTEDQTAKVQEMSKKQRQVAKGFKDQGLSKEESRQKFEEAEKAGDKAVAEILKEDQAKRLKQISLQINGAAAFLDPEVASTLKLTSDQQEKFRTIQKESGKEMRELLKGVKGGKGEESQTKLKALRKATQEKAETVLTDEQKTQWKEMVGAPFTGEISFGRPGRGKRPGGAEGRQKSRQFLSAALMDQRVVLSR